VNTSQPTTNAIIKNRVPSSLVFVKTNSKSIKDSTKKRIFFVGDSVMKAMVVGILEISHQTGIFGIQTNFYKPVPSIECTSFFRNVSSFQNGTIRSKFEEYRSVGHETEFCFAHASRLGGLERVSSFEVCKNKLAYNNLGLYNVDLGDAMRCFALAKLIHFNDILIINAGVHYNDPFSYSKCIDGFLSWYSDHNFPCTFWRQTLPQHFPTPTGAYSEAVNKKVVGNETVKTYIGLVRQKMLGLESCAPLATLNTSRSEQMYNDIADKLISSHPKGKNITTIKLWRVE
jgi:hypothetical protein